MNVLIVGGGSIGERHLRNFLKLEGVRCSMVEPIPEKLERLKRTYKVARIYSDFEEVDFGTFDAAVICTPPNLHIPMALKTVRSGCHVLVEKPLSHTLDGVDDLIQAVESKGVVAGVAYVYRHHPGLERVKTLLEEGTIGTVLIAIVKAGQEFPRYRPDYRNIYFARRAMGGGAILDAASHMLNYVEWCLGEVSEVCCFYDRMKLDVETEDTAILLLRCRRNRAMVEIHENLFQKHNHLSMDFIGSEGTIVWEHAEGRIGLFRSEEEGWQYEAFPCERDDSFVRQAQNFVAAIRGTEPIRTTIPEAAQTLKVCLWAKESYDTGRIVRDIQR